MARNGLRGIVAAALLALAGCAYPYTPPPLPLANAPLPLAATEQRAPITILVSIDGFRSDYLARGLTPRLTALAQAGVTGPMLPAFPSKTFPNHWTLVTGLTPDRHGIVANRMEDAARPGETFTMATDDPFWWNAAEPIWVTAERAGIRTGTMFWPGSNVAWGGVVTKGQNHDLPAGGVRPSDWAQFNQALTGGQRVAAVLDWLRRPAAIRPRLVTLYFDSVDTAGHEGGPESAVVNASLGEVDGWIGQLADGLATLGQPANLVIVADHGMAATSNERTIALDRVAAAGDYRAFETGPYASLYPVAGHEASLTRALTRPIPHARCWPKASIPARFRYGTNPRIPPWFCLADTGWLLVPTTPARPFAGGNHGYDNDAAEMRALFIASGPAFRAGVTLRPFPNTDIAPLLRDLLGLPAGAGLDGDDRPFRGVLRREGR